MTIKLKHNYFIEVDDKNFTLKSDYINQKTKEPAIKTHGYFSTFKRCLKEYIKLAILDTNEVIELHELYIKIKELCEETIGVMVNESERKIG